MKEILRSIIVLLLFSGVAFAQSITKVVPEAGAPGSNIEIYGAGFDNNSQVSIGGITATILSVSANKITATIPEGSNSPGSLTVTTNGLLATYSDLFTVLKEQPAYFKFEEEITNGNTFSNKSISLDLDGDADYDLIDNYYNSNSSQYELYPVINDGSGNFTYGSPKYGIDMDNVIAADFNKDGFEDLLYFTSIGTDSLIFLPSNGNGTFGTKTVLSRTLLNNSYKEMEAADLNLDGNLDLIISSYSGDDLSWFPGNGNGTFGAEVIISETLDTFYEFHLADLDLDNDLDIITAQGGSIDALRWYRNDGAGTFSFVSTLSSSFNFYSVTTSHLNGDNHPDIVVGYNGGIGYLINNGNDTFGSVINLASGSTAIAQYNLQTIDLDGDGDEDIIGNNNNYAFWIEKQGTFDYSDINIINREGFNLDMHVRDFDGDDDIDLIGNDFSANLKLYKNVIPEISVDFISPESAAPGTEIEIFGQGFSKNISELSVTINGENATVLSSDGLSAYANRLLVEVPATSSGITDISIESGSNSYAKQNAFTVLKEESVYFSEQDVIYSGTSRPEMTRFADMNGDGYEDIVTWSNADGTLALDWFQNDQSGGFYGRAPIASNISVADMKISDIDQDGDLDIVVADNGTDDIRVFPNLGSGTFSSPYALYPFSSTTFYSMDIADLDNDGFPDPMLYLQETNCTNFGCTTTYRIIWLDNNDGQTVSNTYSVLQSSASSSPYSALRLSDFDNNGTQDLLLIQNNSWISFYANNGYGNFSFESNLYVGNTNDGITKNTLEITDLNKDGYKDLVFHRSYLNSSFRPNISVSYGNGSTITSTSVLHESSGRAYFVRTFDFNGDGNQDILAGYSDFDNIFVYPTDGTNLTDTLQLASSTTIDYPTELDASDVDNDGDLDVLSISRLDDKVALYKNTGVQTDLPVTSLEDARTTATGTIIKIKALVTKALGSEISVQNGSTGFHIYAPSATALYNAIVNGNVAPGDSMVVIGAVNDFYGLKELNDPEEYSVISRGHDLPAAQDISMNQLGEEYESEIVRIQGLSTVTGSFTNNTVYDIVQNGTTYSESLVIGESSQTELGGTAIPNPFTFEGVVKRDTDLSSAEGYYLSPVYSEEIIAETDLAIHEISPKAAAPGSYVTLYGYGFSEIASENTISFGSENAEVISATSNKIVVAIPSIAEGTANVSISVDGNTVNYAGSFSSLLPIQPVFGSKNIVSSTANGATSVVSADLNNDGNEDLITGSYLNDAIMWYPGNGDGTFATPVLISNLADGLRSVHVADLNNDDNLDILSASYTDDEIAWYPNNGDGTFAAQEIISNSVDGAWTITTTDIDNDGNTDILAGAYNTGTISSFINNGEGLFTNQTTVTSSASGIRELATADLNGNGYRDLISASSTDDKIAIYINNENGSFGTQTVVSLTGDGPRSVFPSDVDGDGDIDLVASSFLDDKIVWYANNGIAGFGSEIVISQNVVDAPEKVITADIDGDGDQDVLSASNTDNTISLFRNNGDGTFASQTIISNLVSAASDLEVSDINNDGDLDIFAASYSNNEISWFENTGTIDLPLSSIANARSETKGTYVKVQGIVTRSAPSQLKIQDNGAGLHIYRSETINETLFNASIQSGDSLEVIAQVSESEGLKLLSNTQVYSVLSTGNTLPTPVIISLSDISDNYESVLVRISNLSTDSTGQQFKNSTEYDLYENEALNDNVSLYIPETGSTDLSGSEIPELFIFEGVLSQSSSTGNDGYQLAPIAVTDIVDISVAAPTDITASEQASSIAINWTASISDSASGYNLYRSTAPFSDSTNATRINTGLITGTSYTDNDLQANTRYYYRLATFSNFSGLQSKLSEQTSSGFAIQSIYAISPVSGNVGRTIKLYGTNLPTTLSDIAVTIGGVSATVSSSTGSIIEVVIPTIEPGAYKVSVVLNESTELSPADLVTVLNNIPEESGYFQEPIVVSNSVAAGIKSIKIADIDADTDYDILTALYNSSISENIALIENEGNNSFSDLQNIGEAGDVKARDISYGDFNSDGLMDVVGVYDLTLNWYAGNGNGSFSPAANSLIANLPVVSDESYGDQSIVSFDIDLDGDTDLIRSSENEAMISIYYNDGLGNFNTVTTVSSGVTATKDMIVIDRNEDGYLDVVIANQSSDRLTFLPNNAGTLGAGTSISTSINGPNTVLSGDIDGDGDPDLLSISQFDAKVAWYSNNSGTSFSAQNIISQGFLNNPSSAALGDLDADDDLDIVAGTRNGDLVWFENQGSGTFHAPVTLFEGAGIFETIAIGDLNKNGTLDILAGDFTNNEILLLNNVDTPPAAPTGINISKSSGSLTLNWDANTESDLLGYDVVRTTDTANTAYTSISPAIIENSTSYIDTEISNGRTYFYKVVAVDSSNSRVFSDVVSAKALAPQISSIFPNEGIAGQQIEIRGTGFSNTASNNTVTFDGQTANVLQADTASITVEVPAGLSGRVPVSVTSNSSEFNYPASFLILNQNDAIFGLPTTNTGFTGIGNIASADINDDGFGDLAVTSPNTQRIYFYLSNGENPFNNSFFLDYSSSLNPKIIRPMNIFGSNYPDFVFISQQSNQFSVLKNNGDTPSSGAFLDQYTINVPQSSPSDIFPADMNNDGFEDVVVASAGDGKISWYENQSFNEELVFGTENNVVDNSNQIQSIFVADLNDDNLPDIISAEHIANEIALYQNNGDGSFSRSVLNNVSISYPSKVAAADIDNDGDLDILFASSDDDYIGSFQNNGDGTFGGLSEIGSGISGASDITTGDLNGDGNIDILTTSPNSGEGFWFRNEGNNTFSSGISLTNEIEGALSIIAYDTDGNGNLDVAIRGRDSGELTVLKNFQITMLNVEDLNPDNNTLYVNSPLELVFNTDLSTITNFTSMISEAISITNQANTLFTPTEVSVEGSSLILDGLNFYSADTLTVSISTQVLSDNSSGQYLLDTDGDGQITSTDETYTSPDFYTSWIGDFDQDMDVDFDDLVSFSDGWRNSDFTFETAPISEGFNYTFPMVSLSPDNDFNIEDIVSFIRFWNVSQQQSEAQKAEKVALTSSSASSEKALNKPETSATTDSKFNPLSSESAKSNFDPVLNNKNKNSAEAVEFISFEKLDSDHQYLTNPETEREITYTFSLSHPDSVQGLSLTVDYDENMLELANIEDGKLFNVFSANATVFLSHVDSVNGILTLQVANFDALTSIENREIAKVSFRSKTDQNSKIIIDSDIRAKGKPAFRQVSQKSIAVRADLPQTFVLSQNYPNPFNPTTNIHYELAEKSRVNITVYDILGRQIETLLNENNIRAGYYKVGWDASRYASGIYIYVMNIQSESGKHHLISKKMMLIK